MKQRVPRLIALCFYASLLGYYIERDIARKHALGRQGYLSRQGAYFDKSIAHFSHPFLSGFGYMLFFAAGLVLYDVFALLCRKMIGAHQPSTPRS